MASPLAAQEVVIEDWRNDDITIWQQIILPAIAVRFQPTAPAEYNAAHLGRESHLHLELEEGGGIVVEVPAENTVRLDEVVGLDLEPKAAHFFAAGTEQRLAA